ncbi:phage integrase family protein [Anaerospora hongkongensis]|uniref:Phage integrase family protein n=1 Tax=Anaerospora hongkongensis TaxID=244830 RepID=A0A4R1Q165_9FIRM|nr:tyrosine-type recombinase/integrase [Anaerospora hongkongensis]TCL39431.1 phage integrase family protein [Anaerospora hongkongensis]
MSIELPPIVGTEDLSTVRIGESYFTDDIWDISLLIDVKGIDSTVKKIDFTKFGIKFKPVIKLFAYHKLGEIKPQTVSYNIIDLSAFMNYAEKNLVRDFAQLDYETWTDFNRWLKDDYRTQKGKKIAAHTGYTYAHVIEQIIRIGQVEGWDVPKHNIFLDNTSASIWVSSKKARLQKLWSKFPPIPDSVFNKILYFAINKETDIITKSCIIIQSQTGLRINEILGLKVGCLKDGKDGTYMEVMVPKTDQGVPVEHKVFVNELVITTIEELEIATQQLRDRARQDTSDAINRLRLNTKLSTEELTLKIAKVKHNDHSDYMFLAKSPHRKTGNMVEVYTSRGIDKKLKDFITLWNIHGDDGELYPLTSHQFRPTFVLDLIRKKTPLAQVKKHFNHLSIEMTAWYAQLSVEDIKKQLARDLLGPDAKTAGIRAKEIQATLKMEFAGKTAAQIDEIVNNLYSSMNFNPLPAGVCMHDPRRGNCSNGDGCFMYNCPNYLTSVGFYPILNDELIMLEKSMARCKEQGWERAYQVHYVKWQYLHPLVKGLEEQINVEAG